MQEPISLTVSEESAELAGIDVVVEDDEEVLIKLEGRGKLEHHLPHTVQELRKNGGRVPTVPSKVTTPADKKVAEVWCCIYSLSPWYAFYVCAPYGELVSKGEPFLLDQNLI